MKRECHVQIQNELAMACSPTVQYAGTRPDFLRLFFFLILFTLATLKTFFSFTKLLPDSRVGGAGAQSQGGGGGQHPRAWNSGGSDRVLVGLHPGASPAPVVLVFWMRAAKRERKKEKKKTGKEKKPLSLSVPPPLGCPCGAVPCLGGSGSHPRQNLLDPRRGTCLEKAKCTPKKHPK